MRFSMMTENGREIISPMEFIPLLEETGLIIPAGRYILNKAAEMCSEMQQYIPEFRINVNVSYVQILQGNVAQDILDARVAVYEDGNVYVYTDASSRGVELTCIGKDANRTVVADDVQQYIRMDKNNLLYIQDGDLYSYNGKEKTRIASDITHFWVASPMKAEASFGTND